MPRDFILQRTLFYNISLIIGETMVSFFVMKKNKYKLKHVFKTFSFNLSETLFKVFVLYMIKPEQKCEMNFTCHDRRKVE